MWAGQPEYAFADNRIGLPARPAAPAGAQGTLREQGLGTEEAAVVEGGPPGRGFCGGNKGAGRSGITSLSTALIVTPWRQSPEKVPV